MELKKKSTAQREVVSISNIEVSADIEISEAQITTSITVT